MFSDNDSHPGDRQPGGIEWAPSLPPLYLLHPLCTLQRPVSICISFPNLSEIRSGKAK